MAKSSSTPRLSTSNNPLRGDDVNALQLSFVDHLEYSLAKDEYSATLRDRFKSLALTVRDRMIERWIETQQEYYRRDAKRVYYLSLEFLIGRTLGNALINLQLEAPIRTALHDLGHSLEEMEEIEWDAGLGNGGLGRLAACFLDSMATLELPAYGYGIRYEYGIFQQRIKDGYQFETPDSWLRYGNPWEIERPEYLYPVKFYGHVHQYTDDKGILRHDWVDTKDVMAMAYDSPVPGCRNNTVNNMRLWAAKSTREFDFEYFNHGNYERAVADKAQSETISKVLYPNDNIIEGRELRLKQEYFFVSATIQDIVRRFKKNRKDGWDSFSDKVAIQLNDTHPAIAIAELMRILVDQENLGWDKAWGITTRTFGYTNHTVLPEALEQWPVTLLERVLPRHIQIIYEINRRFLDEVVRAYPGDLERMRRMSIIAEGAERRVRMAHLAVVGSHAVNGVAALHSQILKDSLFHDFYEMYPQRFQNKTNGITQRRWLKLCNPGLSDLITSAVGDGWLTDLYTLKKLASKAGTKTFRAEWHAVKHANKKRLASYVRQHFEWEIDPDSLFDCQVKRLHEYKRQLLNVLHVVTRFNRLRRDPASVPVPRTIIFAGKAAPGYHTAKLIIKLINAVADTINRDRDMNRRLRVVFLPNYSVTLAELIIPAADLSEQISTAGTEASGTSNMKFALNGALTIGTLDGANVEIREEVGDDNIFIFGLTTDEVAARRRAGYSPKDIYETNGELREALDMIGGGYFSPFEPDLFKPLVQDLIERDHYLLLADYADYVACQDRVDALYLNRDEWVRRSIVNVAHMGKFSSDRTIGEYVKDIWHVKPVPISMTGVGIKPPGSTSKR